MSKEHDREFLDTFMLVLGLLVLFMLAMMVLASTLAARVDKQEALTDALIQERIKPVGTVVLTGEEQAAVQTAPEKPIEIAAAASLTGKEVYDQACFACHSVGVAGAPKFGDPSAWSARIAQGIDVLYDHAINGFQGDTGVMLAKGGRADLSDDSIKAGVDYMVENSQ